MVIALHSKRARWRVEALLRRPVGWLEKWAGRLRSTPKAGFAEVSDAEYERIKHLPGVTKAQAFKREISQLPLL